MSFRSIILISFLSGFSAISAQNTLTGYVFEDTNHNGIMDKGEKGIPGILVSNQETIVTTDSKGKYTLPVNDNPYVFVTKPANYSFSSRIDNMPQYYVDARTTDGKHNFGLITKPVQNDFKTLIIGDPQMRGEKPLNAFKEDIVTEIMNYDVDFAFILGDIADNDLTMFPDEKEVIRQVPYPVFHLFGNHDINIHATSAEQAADIFREHYGPDYFSLDEGNVHFIVLNNVLYEGWDTVNSKQGSYFGGLTDKQFSWLTADLEHVDKNKLIVILSHIPFLEDYTYPAEIQRLFNLLKDRKHLLALSGHLHTIENYFFDNKTYWNSPAPFQGITVGSACGGWWTGPMDERGLPVSTSPDGSPNGYYQFNFNNNTYRYSFVPANHREDFQMRITLSQPEPLYAGSLDEVYASINIFTATKDAVVNVSFNDGNEIPAVNYRGHDVFIENTYDLRVNFDDWKPGKQQTSHLWKVNLPADLPKGYHKMKVTAKDKGGYTYTGYKLIEIRQ